jgi:hypothetical protein
MTNLSFFNARNATPEEIADSFVIPEFFGQIAAFQNLVLVGPRGIGKTTIMKALTPSGLYFLGKRHDLVDFIKNISIDYIPIYIPAETIWKGNTKLITETIASEVDRDHLMNGLFVDHCLHELIASVQDACEVSNRFAPEQAPAWTMSISSTQEQEICRFCSDFWSLDRGQTSFIGLKLALLKRSNIFRSAVNSFDNNFYLDKVKSYPKLDVLLMFKGFFDIVESCVGKKRWSVNFDEMEIAPKRVLSVLYENLRSFDQRAVLKFSLFPYVDFYSLEQRLSLAETGPVDGQDFHSIVLSNKFANPDFNFSKRLVEVECNKIGISLGQFSSYLNKSKAIHGSTRIFEHSGYQRDFGSLFAYAINQKDRDFVSYMKGNNINSPSDAKKILGDKKRAQYIRKVAPIVEFRNYYFTKNELAPDHSIRKTSWKGYGYYHGFDQILMLTEGNPRAIKYYVRELLGSMIQGEHSQVAQNRSISRNVDRFRALVAAQTVPISTLRREPLSTLKIVDLLGDHLSENLLDIAFRPEPALSFRIQNVDKSLVDSLVVSINSGALVVDQRTGGRQLIFDVEGCRVRLSHRLAPYYPLPTITGQLKILSGLPVTRAGLARYPDLLGWSAADD